MPTNGQWIRTKLIDVGDKGVVIADLHKERRANWRELGLTYKTGTYHSFARLFYFLQQLGWVKATGEMEEAFGKGGTSVLLSSRTYYRITDEGVSHEEIDWTDPLAVMYPQFTGKKRASKYRLPTGRPRGRPRLGPPVVEKPPKPPKVRKPRVKKPPEITLTAKDKAKLIADFVEIMGREPIKEEIFTLFEEEVKIRQRGEREEKRVE